MTHVLFRLYSKYVLPHSASSPAATNGGSRIRCFAANGAREYEAFRCFLSVHGFTIEKGEKEEPRIQTKLRIIANQERIDSSRDCGGEGNLFQPSYSLAYSTEGFRGSSISEQARTSVNKAALVRVSNEPVCFLLRQCQIRASPCWRKTRLSNDGRTFLSTIRRGRQEHQFAGERHLSVF
jgi:hypothetical protein